MEEIETAGAPATGQDRPPLNADRFLAAAFEHLAPLKGTHIYDMITRDYLAKTSRTDSTYQDWLARLFPYLIERYQLPREPVILDFGCGTGELTVLMNHVGYRTVGIDVHGPHLELARVLAAENGLPDSTFVLTGGGRMPFDDASVDIINLHVVVEHLSDPVMDEILPELRRICRGVVFVIVPNKFQEWDDHTGLRFVPWMPRWLAVAYVKLRGPRHRYAISLDGSWDVYYRTYGQIAALVARHGFRVEFPDDAVMFPPVTEPDPLAMLAARGRGSKFFFKPIWAALRLLVRATMRFGGYPRQAFYPFLNLVFVPEKRPPR